MDEPIDPKVIAHAMNRLLKRFADVGWVESSAITVDGRIHIQYSEKGADRMRLLRAIFIDELNVALKFEEFRALIGLLIRFGSNQSDPAR